MPLFKVKWSNINQAWFVMFGDQILRIFTSKTDAEDYLDWIENNGR